MKLSKDEVLHIAELARLGLSDSEVERFREQLSDILTYAERLQSVDLSAIPPTAHAQFAGGLQNVMREDIARPSYPVAAILANAPRAAADCFQVPPVLDS